jgi:hypothetical protein
MTSLREERGTVTAFVTVAGLGLLLMTGLVTDGAGMLAAKREAIDHANAAARAGAQAVDEAALRATRSVRIDPGPAAAAAQQYLASTGHEGTVSVQGDRVVVTVSVSYRPQILSLVGVGTRVLSATESARLVRGVTTAET